MGLAPYTMSSSASDFSLTTSDLSNFWTQGLLTYIFCSGRPRAFRPSPNAIIELESTDWNSSVRSRGQRTSRDDESTDIDELEDEDSELEDEDDDDDEDIGDEISEDMVGLSKSMLAGSSRKTSNICRLT